MSRIPRVERERASEDVRAIYDLFLKERGTVPYMMKTVAHRPRQLATLAAHFRAVMSEGTVPPKLKELIAVEVSGLNGCDY